MNAIEIKNVCKTYEGFEMKNVGFVLPQGCVLGLVGENGAGKSTLIRMILGTCMPDDGEISTLGQKTDDDGAMAAVREKIGVVLDEACLPDELTAAQTGRMMAGVYKNWEQKVFERYVQRFGLPQKKQVKTYSRGMKMKLAIACALSHQAKLLVLDEATSGLDPVVRDEILDILNEFTRDETNSILISSHIVSDLEKICDYVVFLREGRVALSAAKDALQEEYAVAVCREAEFAMLPESAVLRVMRAHGAVRVLMKRSAIPAGVLAERADIETIMLMLTKGEKTA